MSKSSASVFDKEFDAIIGAASPKSMTVGGWLNTGFVPLNRILSGKKDGGFPMGRIVEMYGPSSSGKTAIATMLMIEAQRLGGVAIFVDYERSFSEEVASSMGMSLERPMYFRINPQTWEEGNAKSLQIAALIREKNIVPPSAPIIIVQDSIAAAIPKSSAEKGLDELTMNDTTALARVLSTTLKMVNLAVDKHNITALYLNQIRTKPGIAYGDPTTTPGGSAMEFYASIRLALGRKKMVNGDKEMTGQTVTVKTVKNKLNRPGMETDLVFRFRDEGGYRFEAVESSVAALRESGVLDSGAWIEWGGKKYREGELIKLIESNPTERAKMDALFDAGDVELSDVEPSKII